MPSDKKVLYITSATMLLLLIVSLFIPSVINRQIIAIVLIPCALLISRLVRKRSLLSVHKKEVAIVNLSSRLNGNCSIIAKYMVEVDENAKVYEFGSMNFSNCGKCDYECFKMSPCPLKDDLSTLFEKLVNTKEIIFIDNSLLLSN